MPSPSHRRVRQDGVGKHAHPPIPPSGKPGFPPDVCARRGGTGIQRQLSLVVKGIRQVCRERVAEQIGLPVIIPDEEGHRSRGPQLVIREDERLVDDGGKRGARDARRGDHRHDLIRGLALHAREDLLGPREYAPAAECRRDVVPQARDHGRQRGGEVDDDPALGDEAAGDRVIGEGVRHHCKPLELANFFSLLYLRKKPSVRSEALRVMFQGLRTRMD